MRCPRTLCILFEFLRVTCILHSTVETRLDKASSCLHSIFHTILCAYGILFARNSLSVSLKMQFEHMQVNPHMCFIFSFLITYFN